MDYIKSVRRLDEVLSEVRQLIRHKPRTMKVHVDSAQGRILASDVVAQIDVPPFDKAVVDGFAVRAEDTYSASPSNPTVLRVVKKNSIDVGEAIEVAVGDPLPNGADAVVMKEHVIIRENVIEILRPVREFSNVSRRGEDFKRGEIVVPRGKVLDLVDIAAAVSCCYRELEVFDLRAALICTGGEVREIDQIAGLEELEHGVIPNTTKYIVTWFLSRLGVSVDYVGLVPDDEKEIADRVRCALERYDLVVTTGGLAVSSRDVTYRAVMRLGPSYMQRGLAIRPGRPTSIAVIEGKPVLMLSGFPLAALTGLYYVAPRIIEFLTGCSLIYDKFVVYGRLSSRVTKPPHLRALVRARALLGDHVLEVEPLTATGSSLISTLIRGNAVIDVPEGLEGHDEGEVVMSELLRGTTL